MRYYLARYVGVGTAANPYRPAGVDLDEPDWASIDLRPDGADPSGFALVAARPGLVSLGLLDILTDDLDDTALATRLLLQAKLGVELGAGLSLRRMVRDLLTEHARTDGTRWRPLRPERDAWRIRLGEVIDEIPLVAGGAVITESFDTANSDTLGPDLTWTEVVTDVDIVANKARSVSAAAGTVQVTARAESDLATVDHYAQAVVTWRDANSAAAGTCVRYASAAETFYAGAGRADNDTDILTKVVAGAATSLGSQAHTIGAETLTVRTEITGSSLSVTVGAASPLAVTDTAITTGTRTGIRGGVTTNAVRLHDWDNFEAGDLAANATPTPAAIPIPVTFPQASPSAGATVAPAATAVPVTLPQATPSAGSSPTPAAASVPVTLPQASVRADATVTPAAIAVAVSMPQASPAAGATVTPEPVAVPVTFPQATPSAGATAVPEPIAVPVTLPQASPAVEVVATQAPILVTIAFPAAGVSAGQVVTPAPILLPVTFPTPLTVLPTTVGDRDGCAVGAATSRDGDAVSGAVSRDGCAVGTPSPR